LGSRTGKVREDLVAGAKYDYADLDDLTTKGTLTTGHTKFVDWAGLHSKSTDKTKESVPVPGRQIDGYFDDDKSETTKTPGNYYGNKNYPCDSQFVMRFPSPGLWNGKLVISGAPGVRGQYANDFIIGDFVLQKGYAFASTDKGNSGLQFYRADTEPGTAVAEWHHRVNQLTNAAKDAAKKYYGREEDRTYITGNSNGGYLTRYALEKHPELYDGGVDWQGPLWTDPEGAGSDPDKGPNLLTFLPWALRYYPQYRDTNSRAARDVMILAGFEPESDFLWPHFYEIYWNSTQRIYREEFDPYWWGGNANYNYWQRLDPRNDPILQDPTVQDPPVKEALLERLQQEAQKIKQAVKAISLSGEIGKRLITLHGTLDALLPIRKSADKYAELVEKAGCSNLHRYYKIEGGTHIDSLYDYYPDKLRPILPCYRAAFDRLVQWVEDGSEPPPSQLVKRPRSEDVVNSCSALED
jgi:pimeloyl-ACP methyl ester carboxylesterase